jgi:hypothetical protein
LKKNWSRLHFNKGDFQNVLGNLNSHFIT